MKRAITLFTLILAVCLTFTSCAFINGFLNPETPCEHTYDNACDTSCNLCGETRETSHTYDNACDTSCNLCKEVRETSHTYKDEDCDTPKTCTVCGDTQGTKNGHKPTYVDDDCMKAVICSACKESIDSEASHIDEDGDFTCDREGCEYSCVEYISTANELVFAFENGGKYVLLNDIDIGDTATNYSGFDPIVVELDLNGHTVKLSYWAGLMIHDEVTLIIKNGTVENTGYINSAVISYGNLYAENCSFLSKEYWGVYIFGGVGVLKDCISPEGVVVDLDATAFLENVEMDVHEYNGGSGSGLYVTENAYAYCNFDPDPYMHEYSEICTVKDNLDGTWEVIGNSFEADTPEIPSVPTVEFLPIPEKKAALLGIELDFDNVTSYDEKTNTIELREGDFITVTLRGEHLTKGYCKVGLVLGNSEEDVSISLGFVEEFFENDDHLTVEIHYLDFEYFRFLYGTDVNFICGTNKLGASTEEVHFNIILVPEEEEPSGSEKSLVIQNSGKTEYFVGESLDLSGFELYEIDADGVGVAIPLSDIDVDSSSVNAEDDGIYTITFSYMDYTPVTALVKYYEATSLELEYYTYEKQGDTFISKRFREVYMVGDTLDMSGLTVIAVVRCGDEIKKIKVEDYTVDTFELDYADYFPLTIRAFGLEINTTFDVVDTVPTPDEEGVYHILVDNAYEGISAAISAYFHVFSSIGRALDYIERIDPDAQKNLYLGPGVYNEKIDITVPNLQIIGWGDTPSDVVITWDDYIGEIEQDGFVHELDSTATFTVRADAYNVSVEAITIVNSHESADDTDSALALLCENDSFEIIDSEIIGAQKLSTP